MIKKITATFLLMAFMSFFTMPLTGEVKAATASSTLPTNTPVTVSLKNSLSSSNITSGSTIEFVVVEGVRNAEGNVVIQAGAPAYAKISQAKQRKRIGKPGEITIQDFYVVATDGTHIPISGLINARAKSKMALSITLSVILCPLFLLMRGKDAYIPAGTQRTFYTVSTASINTSRY